MKILLATKNKNKVREIQAILPGLSIRVADANWHYEEGLESLKENAVGKALSAKAYARPGEIILAEDTGLFVPALGGAPGVASARYAGAGCDFDQNIKKLLHEMRHLENGKRRAYFLTVCAALLPDGRVVTREGRLDGAICQETMGKAGFGYDPVFYLPDMGKTLAQTSPEEKNKISHRARAVREILTIIQASEQKSQEENK